MAENTLQYVKIDYASLRDSLLQRIRSKWSLSWNDFLANNFGRILVDLMAWSLSVVAYIVNRAAAENFISTMTLRESAVRVGSLVGYKLRNPVAATVLCEAAVSTPASSAIKLSKGTSINIAISGGNATYELAADYQIAVGATTPESIVLVVDPNAVGPRVLNSQFQATIGSENLDLLDSTVDLTAFVTAGQYILQIGADDSHQHRVIDIIPTENSLQPNRLVIDPPWGDDPTWNEATTNVSLEVIERRVVFVQGQTFTENFSLPSTDSPGFVIRLTRTPVIDNSIVVTVNGIVWPVISTLALADKDAQNVESKILSNGQSAVVFGDGLFGSLPPISAAVSVTYRVGGGIIGNVAVNTINAAIVGQQVGGQVKVTITNTWSPGEGGTDLESLAEARNNIPAFVQTNQRGVTANDYAILASRFSDPTRGQVKFAQAVSNTSNSLLEGNVITVYAWTTGPTGGLIPLSPSLKNALLDYMKTVAIGTDYVVVLDGTTRPAPIAIRFKVTTGFSISDVATSLVETIQAIINANKPGDPIIFSDLVSQLDVVSGVGALTIGTPLSDLSPSSQLEIFVPPDDTFEYTIDLQLVTGQTYQGQIQVFPLTAWCFNVLVGSNQILVIPDTNPGFARLVGDPTTNNLAAYNIGLLADRPVSIDVSMSGDFFFVTDEQQLYRADIVAGSSPTSPTLFWNPVDIGGSYVDLASGKIVVSFKGDAQVVQLSLVTTQGYDNDRTVNLYIGYSGDNSLIKRRQVRSALRSWANGLKIGDSIFAQAIRGASGAILLAASRSNVSDVVLSIPGITGVNRVSLDSPSNSAVRLDASATELLKVGAITINGLTD